MPNSVQKEISPYEILLSQVRETLIAGQARIEEEKVRTYWQTGVHINKHILKYSKKPEYGAQILARLAPDLKVDKNTLYDCLKFARTYPILSGRLKFKWSHFRELITISDENERKRLEEEIKRNAWTSNELIARIHAQKPAVSKNLSQVAVENPVKEKLLTPLRGELFTYKIIERLSVSNPAQKGLLLDLGFGIFRNLEARVISQFKSGDIVCSKPREDAYKFTTKADASKNDLYTYQAIVEKIIDGDTLKVRVDLGFDTWKDETLRLRGIDCPELDTAPGQAAKTFVQSYIKQADRVVLRSSRDDKYGRYLADVFIPPFLLKKMLGGVQEESTDSTNSQASIYLNNLLLQNDHAVRMSH